MYINVYICIYNGNNMSSKVHTGFGHGCKRINKSQLDCLEHNDLITYIHCCMSF